MWMDAGLLGFLPAFMTTRGMKNGGLSMPELDPWAADDRRPPDRRRNGGVKIDGTINYGHLLTAGTIFVGLVVWGTNSANDARLARDEAAGLRKDITEWRADQVGQQKELNAKIEALQTQIAQKLPAYENDLKNLGERTTRLESTVGTQDGQIDQLDRRVWTLERFMEEVKGASKGIFTPSPGPTPTGPPNNRR